MKTLKRPNVLLLYTDQQRIDSLCCYGNEKAITPNLDKLAKRGAMFRNFFVQNPVCTPSRISMLTGRYCSSTRVGSNGHRFPAHLKPLNELLSPYGYHTAQIGKLHFDPHSKRSHKDPTACYGFDTFILSDEPGCYDDAYTKWVESINPDMVSKIRTSIPPAAEFYNQQAYSTVPRNTHEPYLFEGSEDFTHSAFVASQTCEFIKNHKNEKFFAISGFYAPHPPINPPERFLEMYNSKEMPLPKVGNDEQIPEYLQHLSNEEWQKIKAYYMALVTHVDDCIGSIINTLDKEDLLDDTLIIFTSDHGEYLGDHGMIQKGMPGHDCIINVPLLISYPDSITANTILPQLTEAVDIVPTILDYCGIQVPRFVQGKSLKNLLEGVESIHKEDILVEHFLPFGNRQSTVRNNHYKYSCTDQGQEILYDLVNDPDELENVVHQKEYKEALAIMRQRLNIRLQQAAYNGDEIDAAY